MTVAAFTSNEYGVTISASHALRMSLASAVSSGTCCSGKGYVILITSAAPLLPEPGFSTYSTARAGASALVRAAVRELAQYGISVNAIAPNYLASEMYYPADIWDTHEARERLRNLLPAGRLGKASEIGSLIVFLSSGQADFINGEVIHLTGGWP